MIFYPRLSVHGAHMTLTFIFMNNIGNRGYKIAISILAALKFQNLQSLKHASKKSRYHISMVIIACTSNFGPPF